MLENSESHVTMPSLKMCGTSNSCMNPCCILVSSSGASWIEVRWRLDVQLKSIQSCFQPWDNPPGGRGNVTCSSWSETKKNDIQELGMPVMQYLSCRTTVGNTSVSTFLPYSMLKSLAVDRKWACSLNHIMKEWLMEARLWFSVVSRKPGTQ